LINLIKHDNNVTYNNVVARTNFVPEDTEEMMDELEEDWSIVFDVGTPRTEVERAYKEVHTFKAQFSVSEEDKEAGKRGIYQPSIKQLYIKSQTKNGAFEYTPKVSNLFGRFYCKTLQNAVLFYD
jgi:hypothetical protein